MLRTIARRSPHHSVLAQLPLVFRYSFAAHVRLAADMSTIAAPVPPALPADAYQLLSTTEKAGAAEDALFDQQVRDVKQWWATSRYNGIRRPYSAEDVVSKKGSLQQTYPSSLMARKLFDLLQERAANGEPVHTSSFHSLSKKNLSC